jgi:uncharacterized repeat protein (TIGR01451 family)
MKKATLYVALLALALVTEGPAWAQAKIEITLQAETEIKEVVDGQEVVRVVAVKQAAPGQMIQYTLTCRNTGNQPATAVKVTDPIPREVIYQVGSAFGAGSEITFSVDGGETYKKTALLSYKIKHADGGTEERLATPDEYTHIQWQIAAIPAGSAVTVGFRATVR